jgi:large subunit ribosomal protein L32
MAVPKRKTSPSRRGNRRAHDSLGRINIVFDKETGEPKLSHHVSLKDGTYNGKEVFKPKSKLAKSEAVEQTAEATQA